MSRLQLASLLLISALSASAQGQIFFNQGTTIEEYSLSGTPINTNLISNSQFNTSLRLSVDGNDLFVLNNEVISEYTTDGKLLNANLLNTNLLNGVAASAMATSGGNLFVSVPIKRGNTGNIEQYTTAGVQVNPSLGMPNPLPENMTVSGDNVFVESNPALILPPQVGEPQWIGEFSSSGGTASPTLITTTDTTIFGVAVIGDDLFTTDFVRQTISEYSTSGILLNASFLSFATRPATALTSDGNDLFVSSNLFDQPATIGEYDGSGNTVNANLITGLADPINTIAVEVPEPSALGLLALISGAFLYRRT